MVSWLCRKLDRYMARRGMWIQVYALHEDPDVALNAYIGNLGDALYLARRGIRPELRGDQSNVCSVGFCEREQKWYGWSHRAIHGFGIGDVVREGDCAAESGWIDEYLEQHPEADLSLPVGFKAKTLEDARRMAVAFAESVS